MTEDCFKHYSQTLKFDDLATYPKTISDMCEIVSRVLVFTERKTGKDVHLSPDEIYHSSSTGELFQIYCWFEDVCEDLERARRLAAGESEEVVDADLLERVKSKYSVKS